MIESWATEQARKVLERIRRKGKTKAVFECGFGPSGLPHIGTVAEMLRTRMVIKAFESLAQQEMPEATYQWILYADDLDALRKVPENIPADKILWMQQYIGTSVSRIPSPWWVRKFTKVTKRIDGVLTEVEVEVEPTSYSDHNVDELVRLLERCGVEKNEYILLKSSQTYSGGVFNPILDQLVDHAQEIKEIITHDYSDERKATYFPFLPIIDGKVYQDIHNWHIYKSTFAERACFDWQNVPGSTTYLTPFANGSIKCQWKLDWPMRWMMFDVDFEMHGKDLIGSAIVGRRICELMQKEPPVIFMYELFLDENKQKISKSKGNGLEADEWLTYGSAESLQYYLFQNPVKGRILHWSCIPQYEDMYAKDLSDAWDTVPAIGEVNARGSSLWFVHGNDTPEPPPVTYSMLLNLVGIADTEDVRILWTYLNAYKPELTPESHPSLSRMMEGAIRYYQKFILPTKVRRTPTAHERLVLADLSKLLERAGNMEQADLRSEIFEVGKAHYDKSELRNYFSMLYQVLLGQDSGPQFDQFVQILGVDTARQAINAALE